MIAVECGLAKLGDTASMQPDADREEWRRRIHTMLQQFVAEQKYSPE